MEHHAKKTYLKLKKKPSTFVELRTTLQKIWDKLHQKPVVTAVQDSFPGVREQDWLTH